jgi:hypothetical protein
MPCSGNANEPCGAGMRLNVYRFDASSPTTTTAAASSSTPASATPSVSGCEYKGCYTDNVPQRVLSSKIVFDNALTLEKCAAACSASGYTWFGVEYSFECYCGTKLDADSLQASEGDCAMTCSGDQAQTCGGPNRLNVFAKPSLD